MSLLNNEQVKARPFLRWAGSKRKLLGRLSAFWTEKHTAYVEPFAGSACLFFALAPGTAVLGDANAELIELFEVVRDAPDRLYRRLNRIRRDLETYNRWRQMNPTLLDRETRALRLFYLNRNCFNGIYRTNGEGRFASATDSMTASPFPRRKKEAGYDVTSALHSTTLPLQAPKSGRCSRARAPSN